MSDKDNGEGVQHDKKVDGVSKAHTGRMTAESIVPIDKQKESAAAKDNSLRWVEPHDERGCCTGSSDKPKPNEPALCPVCNTPASSLSPSPCPGCGKHFCIRCRAQTKDDRCHMCYPSDKSGEESAAAPSLPPLAGLDYGKLKFVPPGEENLPPLDFGRGVAYMESMRRTDFGETAVKQIARLTLFFKEKLPGEQRPGESIVDTAIRLLGHYTHE